MFRKKGIHKSAKKIDKLVTGLIIGGALASVLGVSKTKKGKSVSKKTASTLKSGLDSGVEYFGKTVVGIVKFFQKK